MRRSEFKLTYLLLAALACFSFQPQVGAAEPGPSIIPQLRERFALSDAQVRGSLGALLSAPLGQWLAVDFGWRAGVLGFLVLALGMLPAAWIAGRVDRLPVPAGPAELHRESATGAL